MPIIESEARSLRILVTIMVLTVLTACGGAGGDVTVGGEIVFPIEGMNFADMTITVHGRGSVGADAVMVNGVMASSADGFATWRAPVVLTPGKNMIQVEVIEGGANRVIGNVVVHQGPEMMTLLCCSDVHGSVLVAYDQLSNSLVRIDLTDGSRRIISLGSSFQTNIVAQVAYDWVRDRALVLAGLFQVVDLQDGSVTSLPVSAVSSRPADCLSYDALNDRCYLLEYSGGFLGQPAAVSVVETLNGTIATYSAFTGSSSDPDAYLSTLDFDSQSGRLFAWSASSESLFEIHQDGSRSLISSPGGAPGAFTLGQPRALTILEGGNVAVIQEDAAAMTIIDIQSGTRSTQNFASAPGLAFAASDEQGRVLFGDAMHVNHARGLIALDPLTLEQESFFRIAPAVLPLQPRSIELRAIDFDEARKDLVVGGRSLLCRVEPLTGECSGQIGQFPSQLSSTVQQIFVDEGRDRILVGYRSLDPLVQQGLYEFDSQGGNPTLVLPQNAAGASAVPTIESFARDGIGGDIFDLSFSFMVPSGPYDLELAEYDGALDLLRQTTVPFADLSFSTPIHEPTTGLLYFAGSTGGASADVRAIDVAAGLLQIVSPAGSNGLDLRPTEAHVLVPESGEIAFADGLRLVAVNPVSGARRLISEFGARFPGSVSRGLTRDPETGLFYVALHGPVEVVLVVDPITGGLAQLAR